MGHSILNVMLLYCKIGQIESETKPHIQKRCRLYDPSHRNSELWPYISEEDKKVRAFVSTWDTGSSDYSLEISNEMSIVGRIPVANLLLSHQPRKKERNLN